MIDANDLTFSGRWCLVELHKGKEFEMQTVLRQGAPRLTRLPFIERILHDYLEGHKKKTLSCRLIERKGYNLYFVLVDLEKHGVVEGAYMKLPLGGGYKGRKDYIVGKTYDLYLRRDNGKAHETMPAPPPALLEFVERNKKRQGIFWNSRQSRLHVTKPMPGALRQELKTFRNDGSFHAGIERLYRHSNKVKLWEHGAANKYLDTGEKAAREELIHESIPEYSVGEKVRGRIWKICRNYVLVVLERGGTGIIGRSHLCWQGSTLADPREAISADQQIEATVIRQYAAKDAKGEEKIHIDLSLLDLDDFPTEYKAGNVVGGKVYRVDPRKGLALVELEPGITGILHISEVLYGFVENIADHIQMGQQLSARVRTCKLDPLAIGTSRTVSISLTLKMGEERTQEVTIDPKSIGYIFGKKSCTIKKIQEETRCSIYILADENKVRIASDSDENIQKAVRRIENIQKAFSQKSTSGTGRRISQSTPRVCKGEVKIPVNKIGRLIGKGAATIKKLGMESHCRIWCEQNGGVEISGNSLDNVRKAMNMIEALIPEAERIPTDSE